jgi:hypothetical protein
MLGGPVLTSSALMGAACVSRRMSGQILRCRVRVMCGVHPAAIMRQSSFQPAQRRCGPIALLMCMAVPVHGDVLLNITACVPTRACMQLIMVVAGHDALLQLHELQSSMARLCLTIEVAG